MSPEIKTYSQEVQQQLDYSHLLALVLAVGTVLEAAKQTQALKPETLEDLSGYRKAIDAQIANLKQLKNG